MPKCDLLEKCIFFNDQMPINKEIGNFFKKKYCLNDYPQCARFILAQEMNQTDVPPTLYPYMHHRAEKLRNPN